MEYSFSGLSLRAPGFEKIEERILLSAKPLEPRPNCTTSRFTVAVILRIGATLKKYSPVRPPLKALSLNP